MGFKKVPHRRDQYNGLSSLQGCAEEGGLVPCLVLRLGRRTVFLENGRTEIEYESRNDTKRCVVLVLCRAEHTRK